MNTGLIIFLIAVAGAIGAGAFFLLKKKSTPIPSPLPASPWRIDYYMGNSRFLTDNGNGTFSTDFPPSPALWGYCDRPSPPLQLGQTIRMSFFLLGPGTLVPAPASGIGTPKLRLYMQRRGDDLNKQQYRYWSTPIEVSQQGSYAIERQITLDGWTDVAGMPAGDFPAAFAALLADPAGVGFTWGAEFAGHGVSTVGALQFTLVEYTVA